MELTWTATVITPEGERALSGSVSLANGEPCVVVADLPQGALWEVKATMPLEMDEDERLFMNGYQSWTYSPELTRHDALHAFNGAPLWFIHRYYFDRYADYHFFPYSRRGGVSHGFTWCYFRKGAYYRLLASINEQPGYTIFSYDARHQLMTIYRDCAGVACAGPYELFSLLTQEGDEQTVFDAWFAAQGIARPHTPRLRGYSSWYNRFEFIDETTILDDLAGCADFLQPGDLFQIDDGWERSVGDWMPNEKLPHGMKPLVDAIHSDGFRAGLWLAPFGMQCENPIAQSNPDWFITHEGKPWFCGYNWAGFYGLDIDHPQVIEHLKQTFGRVFDEWGFDLVKLDFLYSAAPFGDEHESRAGRMIRAMELLRELCGDKLILACGVPLAPAFGRVDYCRIGTDVTLDWDDRFYMRWLHRERASTRHSLANTVFRRQLDRRAFRNDPDVVFFRNDHLQLSEEHKATLAQADALLAGVYLTSDEPQHYTQAQCQEFYGTDTLANATDVTVVEHDGHYSIVYVLDGVRKSLPLPMDVVG